MADPRIEVVRHTCGAVLFEGRFSGLVLAKCRPCKVRAWIGSDGTETRLLFEDKPARAILPSEPTKS